MPIPHPSKFIREKLDMMFRRESVREMTTILGLSFTPDTFGRMITEARPKQYSWPKVEAYLELAGKLGLSEAEQVYLMKLVLYWKSPKELRDMIFEVTPDAIVPASVKVAEMEFDPTEIKEIARLNAEIREKSLEYCRENGSAELLDIIIRMQESALRTIELIREHSKSDRSMTKESEDRLPEPAAKTRKMERGRAIKVALTSRKKRA